MCDRSVGHRPPRQPRAAALDTLALAILVSAMPVAPLGGGSASAATPPCAGGVDFVVVRDPLSEERLRTMLTEIEDELAAVDRHEVNLAAPRMLLPLGPEERVTFVWTGAAEIGAAESTYELFTSSPLLPHDEGGLSWSLTRFDPEPRPERVADAVCAAGRLAAAGGGYGSVVLIAHPDTPDGSLLTPIEARRCLADFGVPLFVWTAVESPATLPERWGEVRSIVTWSDLKEAIEDLRQALGAACRKGAAPPRPDGAAPDAGETEEPRR